VITWPGRAAWAKPPAVTVLWSGRWRQQREGLAGSPTSVARCSARLYVSRTLAHGSGSTHRTAPSGRRQLQVIPPAAEFCRRRPSKWL